MFKSLKTGIILLLLAICLALAGYLYLDYTARKVKISSSILLEQVREVTKLVTLEGQFSELFRFEESWGYDLGPLRKSAIVRVEATAFIGYDLEGMSIQTDEATKKVRIGPLPAPKVLSLEKKLDYYDFKQGLFNSFTKTDMNLIQHRADELIRLEIQESDLIFRAEQQMQNHLKALALSFQSLGWELEIVPNVNKIKPLEPTEDPLTPN